MNERQPQPLDPMLLSLQGESLIEASAGTGKTFTIGILYLRLLLGLGAEAGFSRPLGVNEILVVTFTEAASAELRCRIRENIHQLRIACIRGRSDNEILSSLLEVIPGHQQAAELLLAAERLMDEAAIFTIHGFCQRMLNLNALESGVLFEQLLVEDEQALWHQAVVDFWRRHCYPLPLPVARIISKQWKGPDELLATIQPLLRGEQPCFKNPPDEQQSLEERHQEIIDAITEIKAKWLAAAEDLHHLIAVSGVKKNIYSSKHLPAWLEKVTRWASLPAEDYQVPKELARFGQNMLAEKTQKGEVPRHELFAAIDVFLARPRMLSDLIIVRAVAEVRSASRRHKRHRAEYGFDDLLSQFDEALQSVAGDHLAQAIRQRFPAALIDEFQDTDPQQYRIFQRLYGGRRDSLLLLIGDPKQAIYAFRGADIFTYMKARSEISAHYTLQVNWRSSPAMVESINRLFTSLPHPFVFRKIPFLSVQSAPFNAGLCLENEGHIQPAMRIWLQPGQGVSSDDYRECMARQCASDICSWLEAGQRKTALIGRAGAMRPVQASDITVLVRKGDEAALIRRALTAVNIPSVYLSSRESVFSTAEARELLWLLQAVLNPDQERKLRTALAISLFGLDAATLDALWQNEQQWDVLIAEFSHYRERWRVRGVLPMLREIMMKRSVAENLLASPGGERRLTDVMHLSELLQEASVNHDGQHALVRWLAQAIARPNHDAANQQLRLESDAHLVQIVTIHKSKGLEYPMVWLPFAACFREAEQALYHDRNSFETLFDLHSDGQSLALAEEERLAEDLRLLYVALTRATVHCSIGVAPLFRGNRNKEGVSDLHKSAVGWLLQRGAAMDARTLRAALEAFCQQQGVELKLAGPSVSRRWQPSPVALSALQSGVISRELRDDWRVTSYSALHQHRQTPPVDQAAWLNADAPEAAGQAVSFLLTPHTFPRGSRPGTFLHSLFEKLDFTQPPDSVWLESALQRGGYQSHWLPVIEQWMMTILQAPLGTQGLTLSQIEPINKRAEMAFFLPIRRVLTALELDAVMRRYDKLSRRCPQLDFQQVEGMLKGFIDLTFCWQGKYYIADYKSNWLGEDTSAYTPAAMEEAMCCHRYDLQYQLYCLALHRYLRQRLNDYDYQRHFGGVIYLFLRGVDGQGNGVLSIKPDEKLINALDGCFGEDSDV